MLLSEDFSNMNEDITNHIRTFMEHTYVPKLPDPEYEMLKQTLLRNQQKIVNIGDHLRKICQEDALCLLAKQIGLDATRFYDFDIAKLKQYEPKLLATWTGNPNVMIEFITYLRLIIQQQEISKLLRMKWLTQIAI